MLATEHVSVASSTGGTRIKYELLNLSLKRVPSGVRVEVHGHESLEEMFKANAARDPYSDTPDAPLTETAPVWGIPLYAMKSDDPLRNTYCPTLQDGNVFKAAFRSTSSSFYATLGNPDDTYSFPLNLIWMRGVGLSSPEGLSFVVPSLLGAQEATKWVNCATQIVERLWRERLQPYHVNLRVTVDALVTL